MERDAIGELQAFLSRSRTFFAGEERTQSADEFNVFDALGLAEREIFHSRFLASLLNPMGNHGQGSLFLTSFVRSLLGNEVDDRCGRQALVRCEKWAGEGGRLDVLVRLGNSSAFVIENKIRAKEGYRQIERYRRWLHRERRAAGGRGSHAILYLTPQGSQPQGLGAPLEEEGGISVRTCSYVRLAEWLAGAVAGVPERLRSALDQYKDLSLRLGGGHMTSAMQSPEVEFLLAQENIKTYLESSRHLDMVKRRIFSDFWKTVESRLNARLEKQGRKVEWEATLDEEFLDNWRGLPIEPKRHGEKYYEVKLENLAQPVGRSSCLLGVHRSRREKNPDLTTEKALRKKLKDVGYDKSSGWYVGYRLVESLGLPRFDFDNPDRALDLYNDLHEDGNPIAEKVAVCAIELLEEVGPQLRKLNSRVRA